MRVQEFKAHYRLYEIDPLVIDVAREHFSFLSQTAAQTEIVLGDARLQLDNETPQQFDVLVVDAFSGDSVPVHLLTREAFENATSAAFLEQGKGAACPSAGEFATALGTAEKNLQAAFTTAQ